MTDRLDRFQALIKSEHPDAVITVVRYLSHLRSGIMIGRALADHYPDEASWQTLLCGREFLELVDEIAAFVVDVRRAAAMMGNLADVAALQAAVEEEYPRALEAVAELAAVLQVPAEDLLQIVMEA